MKNAFPWKLKALAILPLILVIVAGVLATKIGVEYKFTPEEQEILGFKVRDVKLPKSKEVTERSLKIPNLIEKVMGRKAPTPQKGAKKQEPIQLSVTMIIISEKGSMAIVNGMVVKEGDSVAGQKILQIESGRILVEYSLTQDSKSKKRTATKGTKWINLI
jgi:hypothetical protein